MKLKKLHIEGFRGYRNKSVFCLDDLAVIVGKNDAGKSSLLDALNIFFEEAKIDSDDVHVALVDAPEVVLSCEFEPPETMIIDAENPVDPKQEYLLNEDGLLHIKKIYEGKRSLPKVFLVADHPYGDSVGDLLELKISDLKKRAKEMGVDLAGVNTTKKSDIRHAIWKSQDLQFKLRDIPIDAKGKEDFKGLYTQIKTNHLPMFALFKSDRENLDKDGEAQDPIKHVIKEALGGHETELNNILNKINSTVSELLERVVDKIREMDKSMGDKLSPRPALPTWEKAFNISLTGDGEVPVNKRGSGIRRLILLNFFRVKAEEAAGGKPVIYAVEEPENSQHPDVQKMLIGTFRALADLDNCQVILTTHSTNLAVNLPMEYVRYVRKNGNDHEVINDLDESHKKEIIQNMGVHTDNRVKLFLLLEGKNDIEFMKNIAQHFGMDLGVAEKSEKLVFVPLGGGHNLKLWASRLSPVHKAEISIVDKDEKEFSPPQNNKFMTRKREMENYVHPAAIVEAYRQNNINIELHKEELGDNADVPNIVAKKVYEFFQKSQKWSDLSPQKLEKKESRAKENIASKATKIMSCQQLEEMDTHGDIQQWMDAIKEALEEK